MAKYINPYTDFGFKKLFGEEANKDLLIDFLNQLLPQHHQITELNFRNVEGFAELSQSLNIFLEQFELHQESLMTYIEVKEVVKTAELDGVKKVARELKDDGVSVEKIMKYTHLSADEIKEL